MDALAEYGSGSEEGEAAREDSPREFPPVAALLDVEAGAREALERLDSRKRPRHKGPRTFPYAEGNFVASVHIPLRLPPGARKELRALLARVQHAGSELQGVELVGGDEGFNTHTLHVSLSRTCALRRPQVEPLLEALREAWRGASGGGFPMSFSGLEVLANDSGARVFLGLALRQGRGHVLEFIRKTDAVFADHGLPAFYEDPRPHLSFAWAAGEAEAPLRAAAASIEELPEVSTHALAVECRVGHVAHRVWPMGPTRPKAQPGPGQGALQGRSAPNSAARS